MYKDGILQGYCVSNNIMQGFSERGEFIGEERKGTFTVKDPEYSYTIEYKDNERIDTSIKYIDDFNNYIYERVCNLI